jgi:hypothetical protein
MIMKASNDNVNVIMMMFGSTPESKPRRATRGNRA